MKSTFQEPKPMIFVVEGCDLAGKTTLVEALQKKFPGVTMKVTARPSTKDKKEIIHYKKYIYSIFDYINRFYQSKLVILDRFFPSEIVYSQVKRGYDAFEDGEYKDLERVLFHRVHLLIYCDPGRDTIIERLKNRGDDYINEENIDRLLERYEQFLKTTTLKVLRVDTKKPVEELLEEIKLAIT